MIKKNIVFGVLGLAMTAQTAFAGWPTFHVLMPDYIQTMTTHQGCPAGQVTIPEGTQVPINVPNIPKTERWSWIYEGNNQCFPKGSLIKYLRLEDTDSVYPGKIIAVYGIDKRPLFNFVFHIPRQPWDCGPFVGPTLPLEIGCAQDMQK